MKFCQHCGQRLRLGDRYEAFNALGNGQSSRTFVGLDVRKRFDPRCIVKGFAYSGEMVEQSMERFRQEISRLDVVSQHPQLPNLYGYFERGQQQFLVQELIDGHSLQQELQENGCFDEAKIRQVLLEILPILHHLHTQTIVHRDVKPANLIRQAHPQSLMLVDYGAIKLVTQSTLGQPGTLMGSAEYAAPEQLMGQPTFASDLYSLGVTCIHLLTGLSPFELFHAPTGTWLWQSVAGSVSDRLTQILNRLLQSSLSLRYSSAAEVLRDLGVSSTSKPPASKPNGLHLTHPEAWTCSTTLTTETGITAIALSPDGQTLISGDINGTLQAWDMEQGKQKFTVSTDGQGITALAVTLDGCIVSSDRGHHLTVWDMAGKPLLRWVGHDAAITAIAIGEEGQLMSSSQDKTINCWDLQTGQLLHKFVGHRAGVEAIALHGRTRLLASGDGAGVVNIWHLDTKERLRALSGHAAAVGAIALSPDGQTIISGSWDMTVQIRNVNTSGLIHRLSGHLLPITSVAVQPQAGARREADPYQIATGSHDTTINLWNVADGTLITTLTGHTGAVESVVFSNDGTRLVSASQDGTIRLWHLRSPL